MHKFSLPVRPAARAIVLKDNKMLVIKRTKPNGKKYMVTPGGRLESNETPEQTVLREVEEETTIVVANPRLVFKEEPADGIFGTQHIFLCDYVSGEPILNPESEEYFYQLQGDGTFEPLWLPYDQLDDPEYPFRSPQLGVEIRKALKDGFPDQPLVWTPDVM